MADQRYTGKKLPPEAKHSVSGLLENLLHHVWADGAANIRKSPETMRAIDALMAQIDADQLGMRDVTRLRIELHAARQQLDHAHQVLTAIYSLLYPPRQMLLDGRELAFKPQNANDWMQRLSDRIRAIPNQIGTVPNSGEAHG